MVQSFFKTAFGLAAALLPVVSNAAPQVIDVKQFPTANTKNGTYAGRYLPEYNQDLFLGMPFAQPPVGDLRFRNPLSLNTSFSGQRSAANYASECVGYGSDQWGYQISEDCLYLNVIRPTGTKANAKLPVAVWIHVSFIEHPPDAWQFPMLLFSCSPAQGGGFFEGGTPDQRYNLSFIVQNSVNIDTPILAVAIAYRLSAWGFLAGSDVAGQGYTNMGLRDQRLALHWIQENIAAFGGDPSKVTIWGESAGAASVGWHLTAYNGRDDGLFRAAIMESGNPVQLGGLYTADFQDARYQTLLADVGCVNVADNLECLRSTDFNTLNNAINTTAMIEWFPYLDGDFAARYGSVQLAEGDFVHVPIISGANSDEGTAFGPYGINTQAEFIQGLESESPFGPSIWGTMLTRS